MPCLHLGDIVEIQKGAHTRTQCSFLCMKVRQSLLFAVVCAILYILVTQAEGEEPCTMIVQPLDATSPEALEVHPSMATLIRPGDEKGSLQQLQQWWDGYYSLRIAAVASATTKGRQEHTRPTSSLSVARLAQVLHVVMYFKKHGV